MALVGEAVGSGGERFAADAMLGGECSPGWSDAVGDGRDHRSVKRSEFLPERLMRRARSAAARR